MFLSDVQGTMMSTKHRIKSNYRILLLDSRTNTWTWAHWNSPLLMLGHFLKVEPVNQFWSGFFLSVKQPLNILKKTFEVLTASITLKNHYLKNIHFYQFSRGCCCSFFCLWLAYLIFCCSVIGRLINIISWGQFSKLIFHSQQIGANWRPLLLYS